MIEHKDPGIPNGWYAVAFSRDIGPGEVKRIRYFEHELVLFRTRSGKARVLSAYCPHLGAHLGEGGRVMGETVRCPFHGWQYDGESGDCVTIPYCKRIPAKARVRAWHVVERNHMIFCWYHLEDKPPEWDVPQVDLFEDEGWIEPRHFEVTIPVHLQDMAENNLDPVHFQFVHSMTDVPPSEVELFDDGRRMRAVSYSSQDTPVGTFDMELIRETWNMGLNSVESRGIPTCGLYMFTSTSPIDRETTISRWLLTCTRNMADLAGEEWIANITKGVMDDWRIWANKVHLPDPVLCEDDKLLAEFRRWVKQFYSPGAADAPPPPGRPEVPFDPAAARMG
jgi:phenylpropionate dioxygenase-like ring-hydroxylating dioxygenase large terminal subunit